MIVETLPTTLTAALARIGQAGILPFVASRSGEAVHALAGVLVKDQRRSEDESLAVGDLGGAFDSQGFSAYAS